MQKAVKIVSDIVLAINGWVLYNYVLLIIIYCLEERIVTTLMEE